MFPIKHTIGGLAVAAIVAAGCTDVDAAREDERTDELTDVAMSECTTDTVGMVARLTITNTSSKRSNYAVDVAFESADGAQQYATGLAFVEAVEPGQTATGEAHSLTPAPAALEPGNLAGQFTCRVTTMDRTEDVG